MAERNYLVEGLSGTGKSSVYEELIRRGHYAISTDRAWAERETAHLWPRAWQFACTVDCVPNPGDWWEYRLGAMSAIPQPPPPFFTFLLQTKHFLNSTLGPPLHGPWATLGPPKGHPIPIPIPSRQRVVGSGR